MNKFLNLLLCVLVTLSLSDCGLRDAMQKRKNEDADKAAQHSHNFSKILDQEDVASALTDFNTRRQFFLALAGKYTGTFTSHPLTDQDLVLPPHAVPITLTLQIENDVIPVTTTAPTSADILSQMKAISFNVDVEETDTISPKVSCILIGDAGQKPDFTTGALFFTCSNTGAAAGRTYSFTLDPSTSVQLVAGTLSKVNMLNVEITPVEGKSISGQLTSEGSNSV